MLPKLTTLLSIFGLKTSFLTNLTNLANYYKCHFIWRSQVKLLFQMPSHTFITLTSELTQNSRSFQFITISKFQIKTRICNNDRLSQFWANPTSCIDKFSIKPRPDVELVSIDVNEFSWTVCVVWAWNLVRICDASPERWWGQIGWN